MSKVTMTEFQRADVIVRDGGRCRRCGATGQEIHHRRGKGMGGTRVNPHGYARLILLCQPCHLWAERNRAEAYATGWAVRRSDPRPDCEIPLVLPGGAELWLSDDGTAEVK